MNEKNDEFIATFDALFDKLKTMQRINTVEKIEAMEESLDKLEEELTEIINLNSTGTGKDK